MSAQALADSVAEKGALSITKLFNVEGWICIVTGGGTGLGLVTATALVSNGAKVYITGRRQEALDNAVKIIEKHVTGNGGVVSVCGDASNKEGIKALVNEVSAKETHVNLLVNNHGVSLGAPDINACEQTPEGLAEKMFEEETFERWLDCYRINTASYFFTSFAFLPLLSKAKSQGFPEPGNIINISSISGLTTTSQRGQFLYNASKAATSSLTNQLACEFARRHLDVRVNAVCPGYFPSGMTTIKPEDNQNTAEHREVYQKKWGVPFGRPGAAVDYAQCILSLAVNQYTTGAEFLIDGGWMLEQAF